MSKVTRSQFNSTFEHGIDIDDHDLQDGLAKAGLTDARLRRADVDDDGALSGPRELARAFNAIDGLDRDRSADTFEDVGHAGAMYAALLEGRRPPPYFGADIAQAARDRVAADGAGYADANAPTSPLAELSGNIDPGVTRPGWLRGQNKCNQFAGDTLTHAGVRAPTATMVDASLHYARAETWPMRNDLFDRVTDRADVRIGDVMVRDYPRQGEGGAHVEIVTGLNPLRTTGAHETGAYEQRNTWLVGATFDPANQSFTEANGNEVYVLRPQRRIGE